MPENSGLPPNVIAALRNASCGKAGGIGTIF
jgi:hypothetical protein